MFQRPSSPKAHLMHTTPNGKGQRVVPVVPVVVSAVAHLPQMLSYCNARVDILGALAVLLDTEVGGGKSKECTRTYPGGAVSLLRFCQK